MNYWRAYCGFVTHKVIINLRRLQMFNKILFLITWSIAGLAFARDSQAFFCKQVGELYYPSSTQSGLKLGRQS